MGMFGEKIDEYEVLEHLGKGGFAHVYRAKCLKSGFSVAIKMIDKALMTRAGMVNRVRQEVAIHSRLKHPAILELYTFFEDADYVYLVLELAHNGELAKHFRLGTRGLSEQAAADIFRQVVKGVSYLHSHNILHRDLSLNNLLLTQDLRVKIADFGLAAQLSAPDEKHVTMCGTPNYISPEVASRDYHGLPADVWSLGCMLYTLLVGSPPFHTQHVKSTLTKVINVDYNIPEELSDIAKDLLLKLLCRNPSRRISLKAILEHPFLNVITSYSAKSEFSRDSGFNTTMQSTQHIKRKPESLHEMGKNLPASYSQDINRPASFNVLYGLRDISNHQSIASNGSDSKKNCNEVEGSGNSLRSFPSSHLVKPVSVNSDNANKFTTPVEYQLQLSENKENMKNNSTSYIGVPPLCSARLPAVSHRTRNAILTICTEFVKVEFLKKKGKDREERLTDICNISNDGMNILITILNAGKGIPATAKLDPDDSTVLKMEERFTYHNLPQRHWKKYLYAARFVDLVKAKTPKITIYSRFAKCQLMENCTDFEVLFYEGEKINVSNGTVSIVDKNGNSFNENVASDKLQESLKHFYELLNRCRKVELALTNTGDDCFPLTIGKRPLNKKENVNTEMSCTNNGNNTPQLNIGSFQGTTSTAESECQSSLTNNFYHRQIQDRRLPLQANAFQNRYNFS